MGNCVRDFIHGDAIGRGIENVNIFRKRPDDPDWHVYSN